MKHRFHNYSYGYRIVSISKQKAVSDDLQRNALDFLYVDGSRVILFPENRELSHDQGLITELLTAHDYDVYEIWPDGRFFCRYDDSSADNYFFITGKCNSGCIMCPSPDAARHNGESANIETLIEMAKHIPAFTPHLTITGGEPFLAGRMLFPFIRFLQEKFEETEFLFLTNGRIFAVDSFTELFFENKPSNTVMGIPIHGSCSEIHDHITRAPGSFLQTFSGIQNLLRKGVHIEIRIVVCKLNILDIPNIINLIIHQFPDISYVSVMAMEMTGSAYHNREQVWIPYRDSFNRISGSILELLRHGIDVKLYNFPLCTVQQEFWPLCEKSISSDKVRYAEVCDTCKFRDVCGGVFAGTFLLEREELTAII